LKKWGQIIPKEATELKLCGGKSLNTTTEEKRKVDHTSQTKKRFGTGGFRNRWPE